MRPLEWLLVLSLVPGLLLPFARWPLSRRWRIGLTLLPAAALASHLLVEGWRVQMGPVYLLAALLLAARLPVLRKRTSEPPVGRSGGRSGKRAALGSAAAALGLALGGLLAGWALPVPTLPRPTGPYRVGVVDRELVDTARGRRLMATVWYPAGGGPAGGPASGGPPAPLTRHPDAVAAGLARLTGLPALAFQHLRYLTLDAREGVPVLTAGGPLPDSRFPVLVFSHGMVGLRLQNAPTCQELASWGYVVVALDHTDAAAVTVFADGAARYYDLARFGVPAGVEPDEAVMTARVFPVWVADQRAAYDALTAWDARDPVLAGRLDLARVGSFGHSFGGATALEVCRVDARCRAAADLDGGLYGALLTEPPARPLLLMTSEASGRLPGAVARWARLVKRAGASAAWLELPGSSHLSFTFTQLLSPLLAPRGFDPRAGLRTTDAYLRAFFDAQLDVPRPGGRPTWPPARPLGPTRTTTRDGAAVRWRTE